MQKDKNPPSKNNSAKRFSFKYLKQILFIVLSMASLLPFVDTPTALAAGIVFGLSLNNPFPQLASKLSKILLQMSVVGLGFGIGIFQVIDEGKHSIIYTIIGITITIVAGNYIGRLLKINSRTSKLISFGTAICGGSAIAAMAPVLRAKDEEIAVSLAIVFTLNSIGLFLFPFIGHSLHMSQNSFGVWAALAIHDTSSVVGATAAFGATALAIGTTVKLTRALWITPIVLGYAFYKKTSEKIHFPYFIIGFVLAAIVRSSLPNFNMVWDTFAFGGRRLLVLTLFLIGSGLTKDVLRNVGFRPMFQGVTLWIIASSVSLFAIIRGIIH
jgi:uncharacterized integral membrane protein (TIGR00698 family)